MQKYKDYRKIGLIVIIMYYFLSMFVVQTHLLFSLFPTPPLSDKFQNLRWHMSYYIIVLLRSTAIPPSSTFFGGVIWVTLDMKSSWNTVWNALWSKVHFKGPLWNVDSLQETRWFWQKLIQHDWKNKSWGYSKKHYLVQLK